MVLLLRIPKKGANSTRLFIKVKEINGVTVSKIKIVAYLKTHIEELGYGDQILLKKVKLKPITNFKNPGSFDLKSFYERKGFLGSTFINSNKKIQIIGKDPKSNFFFYKINKLRQNFSTFIRQHIPFPQSEIISALTVGEKSLLPNNLKERFSALGIAHIFAISGLHVGGVGILFYLIVKWILKRSEYLLIKYKVPILATGLTIFPVFVYTALTGFATSATRAFIMVVVYLLSIVLGKEEDKFNTLAFAAIIILLINPNAFFELSFRLSFSAVFGILLVNKYYPFSLNSFSGKILSSIKTTTAATFITLPFSINAFGYLPLSSIPANLIIIPIIEILTVPLGLISIITFTLSKSITINILNINSYIVTKLLDITIFFEEIGIAYFTTGKIEPLTIILFLLLGINFLLLRKNKKHLWALLILIPCFATSLFFGNLIDKHHGKFVVNYLDSGNKNVWLIEFPHGKTMLIKGGYSKYSKSEFIDNAVIVPLLLEKKITELDYLILTSTDKSQLNGTASILRKIKVKNLWTNGSKLNDKLWKVIKKNNIKWMNISEEIENFKLDSVKINFIFPKGKFKVWDSSSPLPIIIKFNYHDTNYILGESIENKSVIEELIETYAEKLNADVLYLSKVKSTKRDLVKLIEHVNAKYIICKRCNFNDYKTFNTFKNGMISSISMENQITIDTYK